jgi:hypothetical protein
MGTCIVATTPGGAWSLFGAAVGIVERGADAAVGAEAAGPGSATGTPSLLRTHADRTLTAMHAMTAVDDRQGFISP